MTELLPPFLYAIFLLGFVLALLLKSRNIKD
jgi:hypothetical protein